MADSAVIIKLGGSVLTRKRENARLRPKVLARLAREIALPVRRPMILLHGAGSFGHPGAVRWRLAEPPRAGSKDRDRLRGAAIVSSEVRRLHVAVLRSLLAAGLEPLSVPPFPIARNRAGRLESLDLAAFRAALDSGGVPVSFGDVVADVEWGFSILSADAIAVELVRRLPARRLVFVSDVEGVFAPAEPGKRSRLIEHLTPEVMGSLSAGAGAPDVTGGIRGKVGAMLEAAAAGAEAGLISGLRHGALSRALQGESVYGSWCGPEFQ